jgi:hypothetical protein
VLDVDVDVDVEDDVTDVVVVSATIDVEDRGCSALEESRLVSMAKPAADTTMIAVARNRSSDPCRVLARGDRLRRCCARPMECSPNP